MRVLATDYDNTLAYKGMISKKNIEAIQQFKEQGNKIGLCSGRSLATLKKNAYKIHFDFYILSTGSYILNDQFQLLSSSYIDDSIAKRIYTKYKYKAIVSFQCHGTLHLTLHTNINQISLFAFSKSNAKRITESINQNFPELSAYQNKRSVDVVCHGTSKGTGIDFIREFYHHPIESIGDSYNDISMFQHSDDTYTFDTSDPVVKSYVQHIIHQFNECLK